MNQISVDRSKLCWYFRDDVFTRARRCLAYRYQFATIDVEHIGQAMAAGPFMLSHLSEDRASSLVEVIRIVQSALWSAKYCSEPAPGDVHPTAAVAYRAKGEP